MINNIEYWLGSILLFSCLISFYFYKRKRLSRSNYLYKKALLSYQKKDFRQSVDSLRKGFIQPKKGIITKEEAILNVKNLELLDLILLKQNVDSDKLTLRLRRLLNGVDKISRLDKNYFYPITLFYKVYSKDHCVTQRQLDKIATTHFLVGNNESLKSELIVEEKLVFT